jgi:hypothetical protein
LTKTDWYIEWYTSGSSCFEDVGYHKCEQNDKPCWIREKSPTLELVCASEGSKTLELHSLKHRDVADGNHRHILCVTKKGILPLTDLATIKVWENAIHDPVVDRLGQKLEEKVPGTVIEQICPKITNLLVIQMKAYQEYYGSHASEIYGSCECGSQEIVTKNDNPLDFDEEFPEGNETELPEYQLHGISMRKVISIRYCYMEARAGARCNRLMTEVADTDTETDTDSD